MNPMSEQEFQDYVRQANWFMRGLIDENKKAFQLDSYHRYDWDQWRGELVFSSGGTPKVVAKIQIVGTLSTKSNGWTWSWANSSFLPAVRQAVLKTKALGEERSLIRLIQPRWGAKESDAWEMAAVTCKLNDAKGAYKVVGQDGSTFMIFMDIRAVSDRKRIFGATGCTHVLSEERPILLVSREQNGDVLALCGGDDDSPEALMEVTLAQLLELDSTLGVLADLPDGWAALRESPDSDWARSKSE
jgi:hypothetical protein